MENGTQALDFACIACGAKAHAFFTRKNGYSLYRCGSCRMLEVHPLPLSTKNLYGEDYFAGAEGGFGYSDYDADKEPMRRSFERSLEEVETLLPQRGTLLDVGAATGFFMAIARDRGWQVLGLEISEYAAELGRRKGLKIETGTIETADLKGEKFSLVTMWDVLEHLTHPADSIKKITESLKPGGFLLINTPDAGSWYAKLLGRHWHLLVPPEHLFYFNKKSIQILLEQAGFTAISVGHLPKQFSLSYIAHIAANWLHLPIIARFAIWLTSHPKLGSIFLPLDLRDNMYIVARK